MNERIRQLRKLLGLTLEEFGAKVGVTKQTVSRIENGVNAVTDQMFKVSAGNGTSMKNGSGQAKVKCSWN